MYVYIYAYVHYVEFIFKSSVFIQYLLCSSINFWKKSVDFIISHHCELLHNTFQNCWVKCMKVYSCYLKFWMFNWWVCLSPIVVLLKVSFIWYQYTCTYISFLLINVCIQYLIQSFHMQLEFVPLSTMIICVFNGWIVYHHKKALFWAAWI